MLTLVFVVIAPPPPRIAVERRIAPGTERVTFLRRASNRATGAVDEALARGRTRLFGERELDLAGIKSTPSQFAIYIASGASVLAVIGAVLGLINGTSLLLAIIFAAVAPIAAKIILIMRTSARRAKFADQVDDTVQLIAGGLRAGHGLSRTVAGVASDADAPMGEELARVVNETRLGRPLPDALTIAAHRMQSDDFEWMAQAVAINAETGGNLAEVLDQVGRTIRERNQIRRHVAALSAEGRLSGLILIALPIFVFVALLFLQPAYIGVFFTNPLGVIALILAGVLLVLGSIWINAVVKVKF
ncbi:type II secretion system F family protein [Agromyces indicus]|uniref:Type II secretion system F family protein n=1 Tax=Agromyces indicus TaxID=758919 RepID=A0ABU1FI78_9MICO|nr:type II secretion system F family protein [Agromyces indicus]MDR5691042.1 type II secretion system F family protein [Agromyces indicus]